MTQVRGLSFIYAFQNEGCREVLVVDIIYFTSLKAFLLLLSLHLHMATYLIASNVGVDGSVIDKLLEQDSSDLGYNLARGLFFQIKKIKSKKSWCFPMFRL